MSIRKPRPADAAEAQKEWQQAVEQLVDEVRAWAEAQGWKVETVAHVLQESLGHYTVPGLEIETPDGRLDLEPVGREVMGADGRVDLYAWPTHYRVMLLPTQGRGWVVRTDSGLDWPEPWGPATFRTLAAGLLRVS